MTNGQEPMRIATSVECAYAAGILDGEGSIVIRNNPGKAIRKSAHRMSVQVCNSNLDVLEWFGERWAATTQFKESDQRRGKAHHKQIYYLLWSGDYAVKVLLDLLPYLIIKREQARLAIDFQALVNSNCRRPLTAEVIDLREGYRLRMKALNHGLSVAEDATGTEGD